jgi:hypothetical protein
MALFTAYLKILVKLGRAGRTPRTELKMIRLVVQADDADDARMRVMRWFEHERVLPTAKFTFGSGRRDAIEVTLASGTDQTPAVEVFEQPGDVMMLS